MIIECPDITGEIEARIADGFRLEMIFPADSPRVAELSRGEERIRIEAERTARSDGDWHVGRAGMEYRDLIPDRLGGRVIASHIRIPTGGPIPDYVHYHHVDFQIIYCLRGTATVVYQDQGEPFEFKAGDCVLQPPGIRHRVLECTDGFEVFEVGSPAEHPTFAEHTFDLPTQAIDTEREFGGQRFVRHRASEVTTIESDGLVRRLTGIREASAGAGDVYVISSPNGAVFSGLKTDDFGVAFVASGTARSADRTFEPGEAIVFEDQTERSVIVGPEAEIVVVEVRR